MADTTQNRRDEFGFAENDPFAELTRIMGQDPRAQTAAAPQEPDRADTVAAPAERDPFEGEFDLDLEKELMGEFDFAEFDQQPEPTVQAAPQQPSYAPDPEPRYDDEPAYETAPQPAPEPTVEPSSYYAASEPAAHDDDATSVEALLEAEFEAFDFSPEPEPEPEQPAVSYAPEAAYAPEPSYEPESSYDDAYPQETVASYAHEPVETVSAAQEPAPVESYHASPVADQDELDAELTRALERKIAAPSEPIYDAEPEVEAEAETWAVEKPVAAAAPSWQADPTPAAADDSLEDELTALLAEESIIVPSKSEPAFNATTSTYGRANFTSPRRADPEPVAAPSYVEPQAVEPVEPAVEPIVETAEDDAFAFSDTDFDFDPHVEDEPAPAFEPAPEPVMAEPEQAQADDEFANFFESGFELELDEPEPEPDEPRPAPVSYAAPVYTSSASASAWSTPSYGGATAAASSAYPAAASTPAAFPELRPEEIEVSQPAMHAAFPAAAATREAMPDIETIDVVESVQALTDDLDIPDADYGDDEPQLYEDLESEITQAFGGPSSDPAADEPPSWAAAAVAPVAAAATVAAAAHTSAATGFYGAQSDDAAATQDSGQWNVGPTLADDSFDYETDLEQAIGMASYEETHGPVPPTRRRGPMIAAVVVGIAAIGGAGVYAMSLFGGGSDNPAIVRADVEPMKVRPENPGGTTVPNQDSQVYQRVTEGARTAGPGQERLITTTEEPMDITAQTEEPDLLPPGLSSEFEGAPDDAIAGLAKSEDRIAPEAEPGTAGTPEDLAAVAPRRVRTMVVRPDGTMVPREDTAPAAAETAVQQPQDSVLAQPSTQVPSLGQIPGMDQLAAQDDGGPVVNMPDTVSVVPTPRVEPRTNVAAAPAAAPVQQQPAATPVSAPAAAAPVAAATSEWSMQVASQPTAESAQAAYQDLARRYGSVLEGRGVNIVRADIQGMGTYFRVRIPAANRDEAIQLCTRYKSAGGSCFVSR